MKNKILTILSSLALSFTLSVLPLLQKSFGGTYMVEEMEKSYKIWLMPLMVIILILI